MIELSSEVRAAYDNLSKQTGRVVASIKADYDLAKKNEDYFQNSVERSTTKVQSFGRKQFDLLDLEQNVATQREVYNAFLERLNQSRATGEKLNTNVRITDKALPALSPESSKGIILVIMITLLSVLFGFFVAIVKELFNNTIVTKDDVLKKLGLTTLGLVPEITELEPTDARPNVAHQYFIINKFSHYAEAIRTLRSSLMLSAINQSKLKVMFTSTQPAEGKTSLALSTAAAFGQIRKTLLIDGDLRRPSVLGAVSNSSDNHSLGLSDLCIGIGSDEECITHIEEFGIDVLTSGTKTPNPQELFCSVNFTKTLKRLSDTYDVIVIDSPPSAGLSDAHLLAAHVDELIYVVKAGETAVSRIRACIQSLRENNAPLKGVVLNQADCELSGYGYSYYGSEDSDIDESEPKDLQEK